MALQFCTYGEQHVGAVHDFNTRLRRGGAQPQFPETPVPQWLAEVSNQDLCQRYYLALDGKAAVRGGYVLKQQPFCFGGKGKTIADFRYPVSEGIVNRKYGMVGFQLLKDAENRQSRLFGLGMGGYDHPLAKLLRASGWSLTMVPFYFRVEKPRRFLRKARRLQASTKLRWLGRIVADSGLGWLAFRGLHKLRQVHSGCPSYTLVSKFESWADKVFEEASPHYSMLAVRDAANLNALYPPDDDRFIRIKVVNGKHTAGWAVMLATSMQEHKHFGDMRVGTIVDCLAVPGQESNIIAAATRELQGREVDLIVTNQMYGAFCVGCESSGYLQGPSNYLFAASPKLVGEIGPLGANRAMVHMTRGDGDGPINL